MSQQINRFERALELVQSLEAYNNDQQYAINEIEIILDDVIADLERKEFFPPARAWMKKYGWINEIECNYTEPSSLAQDCANALNHPHWTSNPTHWIHDLAVECQSHHG